MRKLLFLFLVITLFVSCKSQLYTKLEFWSDRYSDDRVFVTFLVKETDYGKNTLDSILNNKTRFVELVNNPANRIYYDETIILDMYVHNKKEFDVAKDDTSTQRILNEQRKDMVEKINLSTIADTLIEYKNGEETCVLKLSLVDLKKICYKSVVVGIKNKCRMFKLDNNNNIILTEEKVRLNCQSNILCIGSK